mmetsp:Transcript_24276/g.52843  ORF Transcript_24276/g.52843 Transcript_24276/m.52843 type:complete len:369 (+) Transcript_24276:50-1156(+)
MFISDECCFLHFTHLTSCFLTYMTSWTLLRLDLMIETFLRMIGKSLLGGFLPPTTVNRQRPPIGLMTWTGPSTIMVLLWSSCKATVAHELCPLMPHYKPSGPVPDTTTGTWLVLTGHLITILMLAWALPLLVVGFEIAKFGKFFSPLVKMGTERWHYEFGMVKLIGCWCRPISQCPANMEMLMDVKKWLLIFWAGLLAASRSNLGEWFPFLAWMPTLTCRVAQTNSAALDRKATEKEIDKVLWFWISCARTNWQLWRHGGVLHRPFGATEVPVGWISWWSPLLCFPACEEPGRMWLQVTLCSWPSLVDDLTRWDPGRVRALRDDPDRQQEMQQKLHATAAKEQLLLTGRTGKAVPSVECSSRALGYGC